MQKPFPYLPAGLSCLGAGSVIYLPSLIATLRLFFYQTKALEQIAVIGGADAPTAEMLFSLLFRSPVFWITMIGGSFGSLLLMTGIALTFAAMIRSVKD